MPKFYNADGSLTAYALACGYIQTDATVLEGYEHFKIKLSGNVGAYDVDVYSVGTAPDWTPSTREWIINADGRKVIAGWAQFTTLTEARKHIRKIMRANTYVEVVKLSLDAME